MPRSVGPVFKPIAARPRRSGGCYRRRLAGTAAPVPPDPPLTDGMIVLRTPLPADVEGLMAEGADPQTQRFTNAADPYDRRAAEQELRWFSGGWDDPAAPIGLVIADAGDDRYLGAVLLFRDRPGGIVELGYGVAPAARGRGVATRAVRLASAWALAELGTPRLEARTDPDNTASQKVLERVGFTREGLERRSREVHGVRRDMICWSLLPGD